MSAPSKVNKENFRLLDLSSDEESEDLQLEIIPSRKKKITRRERSRGSNTQVQEPNIGTEVQCALRWAVRGTLVLWLLMLTWICAALYDQVTTMRIDIEQVSRSNGILNDALQMCHATTKEFTANASDLSHRLEELKKMHLELEDRVNQTIKNLTVVSGQLSAAPKLADAPKTIADLKRLVAEFGSQIAGFDSTVQTNTNQAHLAVTGVEEVRTLLHQLEARTNDTIGNVTANFKRDDDVRSDIVALNSTLTAKLNALEERIQVINKPVSTAPPLVVAALPTASTTTPQPINTNTNTTQLPNPVKPAVLQ